MSSANRDSLTIYLPICIPFISSSCFIALARNSGTLGIGKDFLSKTQVAQQLRERINKWDYKKLKSFCTTKETVSKLKRPQT
jgi:hypothetical protein